MNPTVMTDRPPYVQFEQVAVEDRNASIEAGRKVYKNVTMANITPPGSRDVIPRVASEWLADIRVKAIDGRWPMQWVEHFEASFRAWEKGQEVPLNGTPIKGWQLISPAEQNNLIACNVLTVEDLAQLPEEGIARVGMGARALRDKARGWLEAAAGPGKLAEELAALRQKLEQLAADNELLRKTNAELSSQLPKRRRPQAEPDELTL